MSNLALPKTGCTSAKLKQGGLRRSPSVSAMPKRGSKVGYAEAPPSRPCPSEGMAWHGARLTRGFGSALGLHCFSSLELSHILQYALSFALSAPCILLTLTRRLRVISNAYFDTPSGAFQPLWWKTRQKYIRWKSFPIPTNGDMRRLKYLQMGIFNWFAKAVVDTGWSLRRAEAVSARIRVYRFGAGDKVVCLWFADPLSGRIKRQDGEA